jgi:hypothetical protein
MVNPLNTLILALRLSNERNLPLGPGLTAGNSLKNPLSANEVLLEIIKNVGIVLRDGEIDSFQRYEELRQRVQRYAELHPDRDEQLLQQANLLIDFLFLQSYPEHNGPIELPEGDLYLTNTLSTHADGAQKMQCWRYIDIVFKKFHEYLRTPITSNGPILHKEFIDEFMIILERYLVTQPLWDQDMKRAELLYRDLVYLVKERIRFENGLKKMQSGIDYTYDTVRAEEILNKVKKGDRNIPVTEDVFCLLTDVRDRLFIEKKMLHNLLLLLHSTIAIADRIDAYAEQEGIKVKEDKNDQDRQFVDRKSVV